MNGKTGQKTKEATSKPAGTAPDPSGDQQNLALDDQYSRALEKASSLPRNKAAELKGVVQALQSLILEHKKTLRALKESEEKYRSIFEGATEGVFQINAQGEYLTVNPLMAKIAGFSTPEEMLHAYRGAAWQSFVHPHDREVFQQELRAGGMIEDFETEIYQITGRRIWASFSARAVYDGQGRVARYEGFARDITARKAVEAELRASEEKYRSVFENSSVGIFVATPRGKLSSANRALAFMFGYETPEALVASIQDVAGQLLTDREQAKDVVRRVMEGSDGLTKEFACQRRDGRPLWVLADIRVLRDENGEVTRIHGLVSDITKRFRAEEALRLSEERLKLALEAAEEGLWDINPRTGDGFFSPRWFGMLDYEPGELPQRIETWLSLIHPDDREAALSRFGDENLGGEEFSIEYRMRCRSGDWRWIHARGKGAAWDEQGRCLRVIGIHTDVTERKRDEEILRESEERMKLLSARLLQAQEEERRRLAAELHDEVGQSLAAIKFGVETAAGKLNPETHLPLSDYLRNLGGVVKGLADQITRIQMDLRPPTLDDLGIVATLDWFCREFASIYSHLTIEKRVDVRENEIPDQLKPVLYRIVQEGMNNAAKHSRASVIRLSLSRRGDLIELTISDDGLGFDVPAAMGRRDVRRGLGLESMKERAELSWGRLEINSAPGEGTNIRAFWRTG